MVKQDEVFFQLQQRSEPSGKAPSAAASTANAATLPIRPASRSSDKR
jgi:hypothetical protein